MAREKNGPRLSTLPQPCQPLPHHPVVFVAVLSACTLALVAWYTSTLLASPDRGPGPPNGPPLSGAVQWLGAFLLAYLVVLIGLRAREDGPVALLDIGWACNLAIGASGCALWQGHSSAPVVVAAFMLLVATDHVMWYLDFFTYLATGRFPLGVAKYITWPSTSFIRKATTTHHIWFLPATLLAVRALSARSGTNPFGRAALGLFVALIAVLVVVCRAMVPMHVTRSNGSGEAVYLNLNLTYECWRDVPVRFLHATDGRHPALHLPLLVFWWSVLTLPWLLALRGLYTLLSWWSG